MKIVDIRRTSANTATTDPIVLREGPLSRLVFLPTLVEKHLDAESSVKGAFVYQKKAKKDTWETVDLESLKSIKAGEQFKLELHTDELRKLGDGLRPLYKQMRESGVPRTGIHLVPATGALAEILQLDSGALGAFLSENPDDAVTVLLKLISWVTATKDNGQALSHLAKLSPEELPNVASLLVLASMKAALAKWRENVTNDDEEFWQKLLADHASVLSQMFAYPVMLVQQKAYVGGKALDNTGGGLVDFLYRAVSTGALIIVEIKTPKTNLLGREYRQSWPLSTELNGAIAQVTKYRQALMQSFRSLASKENIELTLGEPRCLLIAGNAKSELDTPDKNNGFALMRDRIEGVTVITYDELFERLERVVDVVATPHGLTT